MKKISHLSTISSIALLAFIVPQIAFAAWWNPISWFNGWNIFHRTDTKTQVLENRVKELEKKLEGTATSTTAIATTTKAIVPAKAKVTETPAPKKAAPAQTVTPVQPATVSADSQLLMIEKCKAKRDISRGTLWPAFLEVVKLGEKEKQKSTLDMLMTSFPPGTINSSALSDLAKMAKISDAEHEKNLQTAEATMEAQLAKEYSVCLSGN